MRALHEKNLRTFIIDVVKWNLRGSFGFQLFRLFLVFLMGLGIYAYSYQARFGLAVTGMNDIVSWGFYISNFTFFVGVAAAAVMLILPAYIFHDPDFHRRSRGFHTSRQE